MISVDFSRQGFVAVIQNISLVFFVLVFAGCTMSTSMLPPAETNDLSDPPTVTNLSTRYDEITSGAKVAISDPAFPGEIKAKVGREYQSALGPYCYQIEVADVALAFEPVAICRRDAGPWFVAPRIWARSTAGNR